MGFLDKMKDAASNAVNDAKGGIAKTRADLAAEPRDEEPAVELKKDSQPLFEVVSHIQGKNAQVRLWPDRIEWERKRGLSGGKITAGVMTGGASLLLTGVKGGKDAFDMVLLEHVTNVANRKDGLVYHLVEVQTASGGAVNTTAFRVSRDEATQFRQAILNAMQAQRNAAPAPMSVSFTQQAPATSSAPAQDISAQLHQLASLRDAGVLTEEEFAAKKVDLLSRM